MKRLLTSLSTLLRSASISGLLLTASAHGQQTGLLYDPDPPADSAYVRVIVASPGAPQALLIDDQVRVPTLAFAAPSDYLVLAAGKHRLSLTSPGGPRVDAEFVAPKNGAITLAFTSRNRNSKPLQFIDKANSNKLKAVLTAYHLVPGASAVDIVAGSKGQRVFTALAPGASASRSVNPMTIGFSLAAPAGVGAVPAAELAMDFGGTYSLFVLPGSDGQPMLRTGLNKVERYAGKSP